MYLMLLTTSLLQHLPPDATGLRVSAPLLVIDAHQIYLMTATRSTTAHLPQTGVAAVKNLGKNLYKLYVMGTFLYVM